MGAASSSSSDSSSDGKAGRLNCVSFASGPAESDEKGPSEAQQQQFDNKYDSENENENENGGDESAGRNARPEEDDEAAAAQQRIADELNHREIEEKLAHDRALQEKSQQQRVAETLERIRREKEQQRLKALEKASEESRFDGPHWECATCCFVNPIAATQCSMCFSAPPPSKEVLKHREAMRAAAQKESTAGVLSVKLLRGLHLLEHGQAGSVYAITIVSSQKDNKIISKITDVAADEAETVFDEEIATFKLAQISGERLAVHVFRRDRVKKVSETIGFGEVRLDHPNLKLIDGQTKRIDVPLKVKVDGVVQKLVREDPGDENSKSQANISLLVSFDRDGAKKDDDGLIKSNDVLGLGDYGRGLEEVAEANDIKLKIKLVQCADLMYSFNRENLKKTSPYVAFILGEPRIKPKKGAPEIRSTVIEENLNPVWNEDVGPIVANNFAEQTLYLEVRDSNTQPNRVIGTAEINLGNRKLNLESGVTKGVTLPWKNGLGTVTLTLQLYTEVRETPGNPAAADAAHPALEAATASGSLGADASSSSAAARPAAAGGVASSSSVPSLLGPSQAIAQAGHSSLLDFGFGNASSGFGFNMGGLDLAAGAGGGDKADAFGFGASSSSGFNSSYNDLLKGSA